MKASETIRQELLAAFQPELEDLTVQLNRGLISLEKGVSDEDRDPLLAEMFRAAHSIKGGARVLKIKDIEQISHRLESLLAMIQKAELTITAENFDIIFRSVDAIGEGMKAHIAGKELAPEKRDRLVAAIEKMLSPGDVQKGIFPIQAAAAPVPAAKGEPVPPEPAPPVFQPPPSSQGIPRREDSIRVATAKVDSLLDRAGELMVARMRTAQRLNEINALNQRINQWQKSWRAVQSHFRYLQRQDTHGPMIGPIMEFLDVNEGCLKYLNTEIRTLYRQSADDHRYLSLLTDDLHDVVRRIRMLPITTIFELYPRMVRDLSRERHKEVNFYIEGEGTEVDRQLLDVIKDPLTHLLRNAVDHGIETPDVREAAGKPPIGTIRLEAAQRGNTIVLQISDDGAGIDLHVVKQTAMERGVITAQKIEELSDGEILNLIYRSGFSTRSQVTEISGRGVGLDVVRKNLESLQGMVEVSTTKGQGTRFTLTLPLTLATSHVLLIGVGGQIVSVPTTTVVRILKVKSGEISLVENKPAVFVDGQPHSLFSLCRLLELPEMDDTVDAEKSISVVVLGVAEKRFAFRIDEFYGTQDVVIKGMGRQFSRVRNVSGAAILGDGQIIMILNVADLLKSAQKDVGMVVSLPDNRKKQTLFRRLLVVDDSFTTRTLEKNIMENAGYHVTVAVDGEDAWKILQSLPIDAVISDINMPKLDGLGLARKIKGHERFKKLPIVLVSSLESPEDRFQGMEAGADAYIVKGDFDQRELLLTVERLLE